MKPHLCYYEYNNDLFLQQKGREELDIWQMIKKSQ